jgi:hypothetical protein
MTAASKNQLTSATKCQYLGPDPFSDKRFKHDCDTIPGSSGSPVFFRVYWGVPILPFGSGSVMHTDQFYATSILVLELPTLKAD